MPKLKKLPGSIPACIKNAIERQAYVSIAMAKALDDAKDEDTCRDLYSLLGASNLIADKLRSMVGKKNR